MHVAYASLWKVSETLHDVLYSSFDSAIESLQSSLGETMMFCDTVWPYLLPPLVALALEAPLSQRTWLAIQKTPTLAPTNTRHCTSCFQNILQKSRKYALTHIAPVYFLFVSLLANYLQCAAYISPEKMRIFEGVVFGPLFVLATTMLFGLLSGAYALSVRRDAGGDPYVVRNLRPNVPRLFAIIPVLSSLFITHRAILYDNRVCKAVIHTALLHALISVDVRSTKSMRTIGVYAVTNVATLILLIIFLAVCVDDIKDFVYQSSDYPAWEEFNLNHLAFTRDPHPITDRDFNEPSTFRWPLFALSVLWNIFPIELITLCYRFDFSQFARQQDPNSNENEEFLEDASVNRKSSLTHGMLVTSETDKEGYNVANVGPIFLSPDAPDAFYSYTSSPSYPQSSLQSSSEGTPLPSPLSRLKPGILPAFLISLGTCIISTIIPLALLHFGIADSDEGTSETLVTYLAPLLPLVTLPTITAAVLICFSLSDDEGSKVRELWKYVEIWGPGLEMEAEAATASVPKDRNGSLNKSRNR